MKRIFFTIAILLTAMSIMAQAKLDLKVIKETVEKEKSYFQDIVNIFLNDDPLLRTDDIALVYYGHSYLPTYNGGNDKNEEELKEAAVDALAKARGCHGELEKIYISAMDFDRVNERTEALIKEIFA